MGFNDLAIVVWRSITKVTFSHVSHTRLLTLTPVFTMSTMSSCTSGEGPVTPPLTFASLSPDKSKSNANVNNYQTPISQRFHIHPSELIKSPLLNKLAAIHRNVFTVLSHILFFKSNILLNAAALFSPEARPSLDGRA